MQITEKNITCGDEEAYELIINGKSELYVRDYGEPEDNSLCRDLNFVYSIIKLMKKSYEAGKNGETFDVEAIKSDGED